MNKHELLQKYGRPALVTDLMHRKISAKDYIVPAPIFT